MEIKHVENKTKYNHNIKNITFSLIHICNFNCYYYCDAGNKNDKRIISIDAIKHFINNYKKIVNIPINILFTGGEPTLHPNLLNIYNLLVDSNIVNRITLFTNGSCNKDKYESILKMNKTHIVFSYHPQNPFGLDYYLKLLKYLNQYSIEVSYMADPKINLETAYRITNELQKYVSNIDVVPLNEYNYSKEYLKFIEKYNNKNLEITYSNENKSYEIEGLIKTLNYNPFKGMYCESFKRNWIIDVDLHIRTMCPSYINENKYYCFMFNDLKAFYEETKKDIKCMSDNCICFIGDKKWV